MEAWCILIGSGADGLSKDIDGFINFVEKAEYIDT